MSNQSEINICRWLFVAILGVHIYYYNSQQESRAAARKPRDAASVLFGRSSPATFLTFLTSDALSPMNPLEYRHKPYIDRN